MPEHVLKSPFKPCFRCGGQAARRTVDSPDEPGLIFMRAVCMQCGYFIEDTFGNGIGWLTEEWNKTMTLHNSPQVLHFEKQIAAAELGNEDSIRLCRKVLKTSADSAPLVDLIKMCRCLLEIGRDPYTE